MANRGNTTSRRRRKDADQENSGSLCLPCISLKEYGFRINPQNVFGPSYAEWDYYAADDGWIYLVDEDDDGPEEDRYRRFYRIGRVPEGMRAVSVNGCIYREFDGTYLASHEVADEIERLEREVRQSQDRLFQRLQGVDLEVEDIDEPSIVFKGGKRIKGPDLSALGSDSSGAKSEAE